MLRRIRRLLSASRLYRFLVPALALATIVQGYYTYSTASRMAELGERTILESTVLLAREKVEQVEQYIIDQDNLIFAMVDLSDPGWITERWRPVAEEETPGVKAVAMISGDGRILGDSVRAPDDERLALLTRIENEVWPALRVHEVGTRRLLHLHTEWEGRSYLFSYIVYSYRTGRRVVLLQHDTGYLVREVIPELFTTEEARRQFNVEDMRGRRIYGNSLGEVGDYLVGRRFPTTLYDWRLQVAPKQASLLEAEGRSRRRNDVILLATSFAVLVLGLIFLTYAADKERRLNRLKSELIANLSHEIKTPLSVVRMFGEMLLTGRVRTKEKELQYLEIICRESERLSALIENVLDFSALERGKQKYERREAHLEDAVNRAIETFRYRVEKEGIEIRLDCPDDLPSVWLDEQGVMLAIINLLDNAVKYGEGTPVDVSVVSRSRWVEVRVRDRGPGIPHEAQRRVFERFYRHRSDPSIRGSGIGLSLVKHIAEAHGGRAWAESPDDGQSGAVVAFSIGTGPVAASLQS